MYTRGHGLSTLTWTFTPLISLKEWDVGPALTWSCPINSIDWARITPLNLEIYYRAHKYLAGANFINWLKEIDFTDPGESAWFKHRPAFKSLSPWICLDYIRNFLGYIFSCLYTWLDYTDENIVQPDLAVFTRCDGGSINSFVNTWPWFHGRIVQWFSQSIELAWHSSSRQV